MLLASPAALLPLLLLAAPPEATEPSRLLECEPANPRVELTAEPGGKVPVVCVGSGRSTTLRFDSPLAPAAVDIPERERFVDVAVGKTSLLVVPPENLAPGERLKVAVCFADGAAPACATFWLVAHPGRAMQQVDVFRQPRPVAYYQQVAEAAQAEARQCRTEVQQLRAGGGTQGGLTALLAAGLMEREWGVAARDIRSIIRVHEGAALTLREGYSYRARGRVAVEVWLSNPGARAWSVAGAALRGPHGELMKGLTSWQPAPLLPGGKQGRVVVELPATEEEARGTYTLTLWDEDQARTITLANVTFP